MWRILLVVSAAALALAAAASVVAAAPVLVRTPGTELVELRHGNGRAVVTGRGALLLHLRRGQVRLVDRPGGDRPNVNRGCRRRAERVSPTTLEIRGRDIGCFISSEHNGGPWQAVMRGRRISASGSVKGSVTLDAVDTGRRGRFRIGEEDWRRWPRTVRTYVLDRK
ncbi:MAG: hypothetical protein ACRDLZ_11485 [Gaiellaceae bacterium]